MRLALIHMTVSGGVFSGEAFLGGTSLKTLSGGVRTHLGRTRGENSVKYTTEYHLVPGAAIL